MIYKTRHKSKTSLLKTILEWGIIIIIAIIASLFIVSNIVSISQIKEESMEPTFKEDDRVVVYKLGYQFKTPKRGDVVILNRNQSKRGIIINIKNEARDIIDNIVSRFTGVFEKNNLIKRVVAIPGDRVDILNGIIYINDKKEEAYGFLGLTYDNFNTPYPIEIPQNKLFVLGDNRENSLDSRGLGLIDQGQLKGKVSFRLWPLDRLGKIK